MKKFILALAMVAFISSPALATIFGCPPGQEKKGWKCVDIEEPDSGTTINNDINNRIDNRDSNVNIVAPIQNTDVDIENKVKVDNDVKVKVDNDNKNLLLQGQTAHNEGVDQKVIINEADIPITYNHITPTVGKTDANLLDHGGESQIRTYTSIFNRDYDDDDFITYKEAKKACSGAKIEVIKALLWEADTRLEELNYITVSGKYMGSITLTTEDATLDQVLARAARESMYVGATSFAIVTNEAKDVSATKYGVDFGGSSSVSAKADGSIMIAPGATLGWSKTHAKNIIVGEVYVMLFRNDNVIVK